jgi:hypothetical protein
MRPVEILVQVAAHIASGHDPQFSSFDATMAFVDLDIVRWRFCDPVDGQPFAD